MTTQSKSAEVLSTLTEKGEITAVDGIDQLQKIAKEAKSHGVDIINEAEQKMAIEVDALNTAAHSQLTRFKQDLFSRIEVIKGQFQNTKHDLSELKSFVRTELDNVLNDFTVLSHEIKQDVTEISTKHKAQIVETFKRSKDHTLDIWHKVSTKQ